MVCQTETISFLLNEQIYTNYSLGLSRSQGCLREVIKSRIKLNGKQPLISHASFLYYILAGT